MSANWDSQVLSRFRRQAIPALLVLVFTGFNLLPQLRGTYPAASSAGMVQSSSAAGEGRAGWPSRPARAVTGASLDARIAVGAIGITVSDLDRSVSFFENVLSFEKVSETELIGSEYERLQGVFGLRMRVASMRLGGESIELTEYLAPRGRPVPLDSRSNDRWFQHIAIITSDMDRAYRWLREHEVEHASTGPQLLPAWNKNAGGIRAFYFKDPDGHPLEILQFPPDKGAAKWHQKTDRLFLGIDHTAIVVSNTDASLRFYRDTLGMQVVGETENFGEEQERLNNVFGARLRITALRAPDGGPGVEFLEYLSPRDGRPRPADARANDLIHWQTAIAAPDLDRAAEILGSRSVELEDGRLGFKSAFLIQDPDGHVLRLEERHVGRHSSE